MLLLKAAALPRSGQISLVVSPLQRRNFILSALACMTATHPLGKAASGSMSADAMHQKTASGVFGYSEIPSHSFQILPQWQRVLGYMRHDGAQLARCGMDAAACDQAAQDAWHRLIGEAMPLSTGEKVTFVNRYFNRWPYRLDKDLYGVSEYWASPIEFLGHSGDCEDYSIAKFFALRQLGLGNDRLRVIILLDTQRAVGHAVLALYDENEIYILDSLSDEVLPHWHYKHYKPQYSMNETTRWTHLPPDGV